MAVASATIGMRAAPARARRVRSPSRQIDKTDDCHGQRLEDGDQGAGEVAGDAADARCVTKGRSVTVDLGGSIHDQLGEEGVEVREVSVQDTFGDPSLCGHGPARQRRRSLAAQDPLGGLEQHLAWVL